MLGNKENNKQILRYVLPSVSAMIVSFTYNMVDGMFVGQGVGPSALASVNLAMPFTQIMTGIASMLAIGGATAMAIYKGKEDTKRANQVFFDKYTVSDYCWTIHNRGRFLCLNSDRPFVWGNKIAAGTDGYLY
ncbi:MATE family efflux transporter [Enterococcus malodoratus]|uniref:MATE family efflux transporter n=1 Tax=Enterococcus malodoratus TaxID=71451 RepID=UPI002073BB35|nr:MATE family efflux transporter [Enterococcus malodoratus]